jgi:hypothetical protein
MSLSAIASQLYTIQTRKKVPLSTAFKLMAREDLAMRFSVYNLARIITKSEFIATVAQAAFGQRTPLQRKQDEQEIRKEKAEKRFKQFTATSIASLNRKITLLANITERNTTLISGIYSELGAFRMQRRMSIDEMSKKAVRINASSKTIKGQLDLINEELQKLKTKEKRTGVRGVTAKKKTQPKEKEKTKEKEKSEMDFFNLILRNPRLFTLISRGGLRSIGLASFAAQAYALYNLPGALGRAGTRMGGKAAYEDPITEEASQFVDPLITGLGSFTVMRAITGGISMLRNRGKSKLQPFGAAKGRLDIINKMIPGFRERGMDYKTAQRVAGQRAAQFTKYAAQLKKMKILNSAIGGFAKNLPAIAAADVAFEVSRMSGYVADRSTGKIGEDEFKQNMTNSYAELITTVGVGGMSTILGGLAGTALFPGVGTLAGAVGGGILGAVMALFIDEENDQVQALARKLFELIHEDKAVRPRAQAMQLEDQQMVSSAPVSFDPNRIRPETPILSSLLERGESKAFGGYTAYNQKIGDGFKAGKADFSQLTIDDILAGQSRGQFFAVGKYQMIPTTLKAAKENLGLTGNEKFTPQIQEYIFANYLIGDKRPAIRDYLSGKSDNLDAALLALSQEWSSVSTEYDSMKSYYAKDKASISKREAAMALQYERQRRMALMQQGEQVGVMATPVTTPPPPVNVVPNAAVSVPPETPPMASNQNSASNSEDTEIKAESALIAASAIKSQLNNVAQETSKRINAIEKLSETDMPGYTHNDPSLQGYRVNV